MWPFKSKKIEKETLERLYYLSENVVNEKKEIEKMTNHLKEVFSKMSNEIVFLCIGTDRSTGDSLGPFVGSMLIEREIPFPVYGTLEKPVHALNIKKVLNEIQQAHNQAFIFGIDACLGTEKHIGSIILEKGSFIPGNALKKVLPIVGDYHLKAVVNVLDPFEPAKSLNSTRLYNVTKLAEIMTEIIYRAVMEASSSKE